MEVVALDPLLTASSLPSCATDAGVAEHDAVPWMSAPNRRHGNRRHVTVTSGVPAINSSRFAALLSEETAYVAQNAEEEDKRTDTIGNGAKDKEAQHEHDSVVNKMVPTRMLPKHGPRLSCSKVSRKEGNNKAAVDSPQSNCAIADQHCGRSTEATLAQAAQSEAIVVETPRPRERVCRRQPSDSAASVAVAVAFASNILTLMGGDPAAVPHHGQIKASGNRRWQQHASAVHRGRRDVQVSKKPVMTTVRRRNGR